MNNDYDDVLDTESSLFDSRQRLEILLVSPSSRLALEPTHPPVKMVPGYRVRGSDADHSPPSSAKVEYMWSYTSTPSYVCMVWRTLYFTLYSSSYSFCVREYPFFRDNCTLAFHSFFSAQIFGQPRLFVRVCYVPYLTVINVAEQACSCTYNDIHLY
jgi:hypothetical protein